MAGNLACVVRRLHTVFDAQSGSGLSDAELLQRFLANREEIAFAVLVQRHGPMVLSVSRRVVSHEQDAEDVFQATFLVLARKARSIRRHGSLASWLYGVAYRIGRKLAAKTARRNTQEKRAFAMPSPKAVDALDVLELRRVLDEEINKLPEKYRVPIVLCYLQGKSQQEAAQEVGWSKSSLASRLVRARQLLEKRLTQRGIGLSASLLAVALTKETAGAAVPALLAINTVRAAALTIAGKALSAGVITARASALAEGAIRALFLTKLKACAIVLVTAAAMILGAGLLAQQTTDQHPAAATPQEDNDDKAPAAILDRLGDPLPTGAVLRLGTLRLRHKESIAAVAFVPHSRIVITGGGDDVVSLWDRDTGQELRRLQGHEGSAVAIAVSPDGKLIATAGVKTVCLWDLATGKLLEKIPADTTTRVDNGTSFLGRVPLVFSADGKLLAFVTSAPSVRVWDVAARKERLNLKGHRTTAEVLGFSADGKTLTSVSGDRSADGEIRQWDTSTGTERASIRVALKPVRSARPFAISPDGRTLAIEGLQEIRTPLPGGGMQVGTGYALRLWDLDTLKERLALSAQPEVIWSAAFSPDSTMVAAALMGGRLVVWDAATGKALQACPGIPDGTQPTGGHTLAFSHDAKVLASAGSSTVLGLWDVTTSREALNLAEAHNGDVAAVAIAPDGRTIATAGGDHTIRLWNRADARQRIRMSGHKDAVRGLAYSPDGKRLASSSRDGAIKIWNAGDGKELTTIQAVERTSGAYYGICPIAFTPDGKSLVSWGDDRMLRIWDATTGKPRAAHPVRSRDAALVPGRPAEIDKLGGGILAATFTADGRLAALAFDKAIYIVDVATGHELMRLQGTPSPVTRLAFSPDGNTLVSGGWDKTIRLWETTTGQEILKVEGLDHINSVAFAADQRTVAAAAGWVDGKIYVVDGITGKMLKQLRGHGAYVGALAFAADGKSLVSGQRDTTGLVWDISAVVNRPRASALKDQDLSALWNDLASSNPGVAHAAIWRLVDGGERVVQYFQERLAPVAHTEPGHIAKLIADLDSPQFATRDAATKELANLGTEAHPALREAMKGRVTVEGTRRIESLLNAPPPRTVPAGDLLRRLRAIQVLDHLNTPAAAKLLHSLANGAPGARETNTAKQALRRKPI